MIKGKFYLSKCAEHRYSADLEKCIETAFKYCLSSSTITYDEENNHNEKKPIMLLGKIQSGKTRAYTGLMSLAFDNGFDMVIILTKNSKALVQQTYKRMRREFIEPIQNNEIEVFDIMKALSDLTDYELNKKLIIVTKKETRNLGRISSFITDYTIEQRKNCLIIDDEADTTGIGFNKIKDTDDEFYLRTIASKVNDIRGNLNGCVFIQVTATPYSLYLQPEFNSGIVEPIKPRWTVLVPSGEGYVGGEYYFIKSKELGHPAELIFEEVPLEEHNIITLKREDRRRFKDEEILIRQDKLCTFKKGLMNFVIGGCVLRRVDKNAHYAYVIHTNTQKEAHLRIENLTKEFWLQIKNRDEITIPIIEELILEAYLDIEKSVMGYKQQMPNLVEILRDFYKAVDKGFISVTTVNSDKDVATILNEDNGELNLRSPFSILVGGQVLDRGVTIPQLIGFYYGRNPKMMQQDTVLQHSRMFGYRDENLLSVTRFYTTRRIFENMTKVTEVDIALREDLENGVFDDGVYFIQTDEKGQIVPCSPSKVRMSNIIMLKPERRILPVGFSIIAKSKSSKISNKISSKISTIMKLEEKKPILTSMGNIESIINLVYSLLISDEGAERFISKERFLTTLKYLASDEGKIYLIVRRGRKLSKYKGDSKLYSDAPDTPQDELSIAKKFALRYPALILIHQDGTAEGWDGCEFWWPILIVQFKSQKTIFALENPIGKVREKPLV